jgi:hypothetical protein
VEGVNLDVGAYHMVGCGKSVSGKLNRAKEVDNKMALRRENMPSVEKHIYYRRLSNSSSIEDEGKRSSRKQATKPQTPSQQYATAMSFPVHIVTQWSPHQQPLFDLWVSSLANAMTSDGSNLKFRYTVHAKFYRHEGNFTERGLCCDSRWSEAVKNKIKFIAETARSLPRGEIAIFSDIDIVFFNNSLAKVIEFHISSGSGVTFQPRWKGLSGMNTGFFALNVSESAILFLDEWAQRITKNDQDTLNSWFEDWGTVGFKKKNVCKGDTTLCPTKETISQFPTFGTFPASLVVGQTSGLSKEASLFHVVGRSPRTMSPSLTGVAAKLERLKDVFNDPQWKNKSFQLL